MARVPRLLLIRAAASPPVPADELEDWLREPWDRHEMQVRRRALARRGSVRAPGPVLDHDGVVWFGGSWTTLPRGQVALARALVDRFGRTVSDGEVAALRAWEGASVEPEALRAAVARLDAALQPLRLAVTRVRGRGWVLDAVAGRD
jgi:DNA-binding response OmpR family regulator